MYNNALPQINPQTEQEKSQQNSGSWKISQVVFNLKKAEAHVSNNLI